VKNFGHFNIQEHLIKEPTKNIEAYNLLFLKVRYQHLMWDGPRNRKATELYDKAFSERPLQFALGLTLVWAVLLCQCPYHGEIIKVYAG